MSLRSKEATTRSRTYTQNVSAVERKKTRAMKNCSNGLAVKLLHELVGLHFGVLARSPNHEPGRAGLGLSCVAFVLPVLV